MSEASSGMDKMFNNMNRMMESHFNNMENSFGMGKQSFFDEGPFTTGHRRSGQQQYAKPRYEPYEDGKFLENSVVKSGGYDQGWQNFTAATVPQPEPRRDYYPKKSTLISYDNNKRGVYVPNNLKNENSPVNTRGIRRSPYLEPLQPAPINPRPVGGPARESTANRAPPRNDERAIPMYSIFVII